MTSFSKEFFLDLLFPKACLNCGEPGEYLCQDCQALVEVLERQFCPVCSKVSIDGVCLDCRNRTNLSGLYFAVSYKNPIVKKLIAQFKYEPFVKDLAGTLSSLIISHFQLLNKKLPFLENPHLIIPVPLHKKRLKWRGYNQAEELAKGLSAYYGMPVLKDFLFREKQTLSQQELKKEERKENIKGAFVCKNGEDIKGKKILLIDDVFTTGSTMEECARVLKEAGAEEVLAVAVAREE